MNQIDVHRPTPDKGRVAQILSRGEKPHSDKTTSQDLALPVWFLALGNAIYLQDSTLSD